MLVPNNSFNHFSNGFYSKNLKQFVENTAIIETNTHSGIVITVKIIVHFCDCDNNVGFFLRDQDTSYKPVNDRKEYFCVAIAFIDMSSEAINCQKSSTNFGCQNEPLDKQFITIYQYMHSALMNE